MSTTFLVAFVLLWVLVAVLSVLVFALARQVGVLHERVAPAGALMPTAGPKVGELTEPMALTDVSGPPVTIGGANTEGLSTLVLFVSPTCPVCKSLVPTARSLAGHEGKRLQLAFASDGGKVEQHLSYVKDLGIARYPYIVSQALGLRYAVSKLPFAVLIGADGVLKSKGLVNSREHLESLIESMDTGIASLQDYVDRHGVEFDSVAKEHAS